MTFAPEVIMTFNVIMMINEPQLFARETVVPINEILYRHMCLNKTSIFPIIYFTLAMHLYVDQVI